MSGKKFWAFVTVYLVFQTARGDHNGRPGSERRQDLSENVIVSQVAEALAKGLEESLKDCKIDPDNPDESLRLCMEERDAEKAKKLHEVFDGEKHDTSKHYKLLKTALLNLNEQMKDTNSSSEEDISELLNKLDSVVKLLDVKSESLPEVQGSTLVEVPTEMEIEEAVVMQDYEHHHVDFWDTLFGLSDKVALGLLLTIKSVPRPEAKDHLKKFLQGTDEERLKILGDTLNLQRPFESDLDKVVEELADMQKEATVRAEKRFEAEAAAERRAIPAEVPKKQPSGPLGQESHPKKLAGKDVLSAKHTHRSGDVLEAYHVLKENPGDSLDHHAHGFAPATGHQKAHEDAELSEEASLEVNFAVVCSLFALVLVALGLYLVRSKFLVGRHGRANPGYRRVHSKGF